MPPEITLKEATDMALMQINTSNTRAVRDDTETYGYLLSMFNGTLSMASGKPSDIVIGMVNKGLATVSIASSVVNAKNIKLGTSVIQILVANANLVSLAGKASPAAVLITVGATFATKISLALGLAGESDKRAKCLAAMADIAAAGGTLALGAMTAPAGVGALLIASSLAQLVLGGYKASKACKM